jgi:hypothetical protein
MGIKISYLPYVTWENMTDQNNNSFIFETTYSATLSLYCSTSTNYTCTRIQGNNVTEIRNGVNYTTLKN